VRYARLHLQTLYDCLTPPRCTTPPRLTSRAMHDLIGWMSLATSPGVCRALWQLPVLGELTTDACGHGWDGLLNRLVPARSFFSLSLQADHINVKELSAILFTLRSLPALPGPGVFRFRSDSLVNVHELKSMRSRSPALISIVRELHRELHSCDLRAEAYSLSSIANAHADKLSRDLESTDRRLRWLVFLVLHARWRPLTIDRSATDVNTNLPRLTARVVCPNSEAVEDWRQHRTGEAKYINPLVSQAALAIAKIASEGCHALLTLPI